METDLQRHKPSNPYNYDEIQLAKRKRDIKAMIKDFPTVSPMWCEWLYDVIENMPKEEVENIIKNKLWEGEGKFAKAPGGVLHTVEVFNEDFTPFNSQKIIK